jgi:membrane fusion protein (multidrug efflux system)
MKKIILTVGLVLVFLGLVWIRIASQSAEPTAKGIEEVQAEEGIPVDVVTVSRDSLIVTLPLVGQVSGWRQSDLTASGDYKVESVFVKEGDRVEPGQLLLRYDIETSPDRSRLRQAREAWENARRQYERLQALYDEGALAESQLDDARTRLRVARADYESALREVEVLAPISGIVTLVAVRPGDVVAFAEPLLQIAVLDSVRVTASVSQTTASLIRPGALARARGITGRVVSRSLGADPDSRLFRIEMVLPNPGGLFRPGETVACLVEVSRLEQVVTLPREALLGRTDPRPGVRTEVYVVEEGLARRRQIVLGEATEDRVAVREGLVPGEIVVVFGANRLREGAKVKIHRLDGRLVNRRAEELETTSS